jgi:Secretion system C-terminal sorting domain
MKYCLSFLLILTLCFAMFSASNAEEPEFGGGWDWPTGQSFDSLSAIYKASTVAANGDMYITTITTGESGIVYWYTLGFAYENSQELWRKAIPIQFPASTWGIAVNEIDQSAYIMGSRGNWVELMHISPDGDSLWTVNITEIPLADDIHDIFELECDIFGNAVLTGTAAYAGNPQYVGPIVMKIDTTGTMIMSNVWTLGDNAVFSKGVTEVLPNGDVQISGSLLYPGQGRDILNTTFSHEENGAFNNTTIIDIGDDAGELVKHMAIDENLNKYIISGEQAAGGYQNYAISAFDPENLLLWTTLLPNGAEENGYHPAFDDIAVNEYGVWASGHYRRDIDNLETYGLMLSNYDLDGAIQHNMYRVETDTIYYKALVEPIEWGGVVLTSHNVRPPQATELPYHMIPVDKYDADFEPIWRYQWGMGSEQSSYVLRDAYNIDDRFYVLRSQLLAGHNTIFSFFSTYSLGVDENREQLPAKFELTDVYPNPFNASTAIKLKVDQSGRVDINVYNMLGQKVATVWDKNLMVGYHRIMFYGNDLASGTYLVNVSTPDGISSTKRIVLLK